MSCIAYLTSEYPAVSHTFIRREIAALRRRGLDVVPFSVRPSAIDIGEDVPSIIGKGWLRCLASSFGTVLRSPRRSLATCFLAQRHRVLGWRGLIWAQFHLIEALALASMLRQVGASHLHSHFANSGATVGMLAAHSLGLPWSLTLHGISETDPPAGSLLRDKIMRAEFVACASWFMRAQGMRVVPQHHWNKLHVSRCGVDLNDFRSLPDSRREAPFHFVTVGRISAEKGYPGLLQAFSELANDNCVHLTIVGDGPLRTDLEQTVASLGLSEHVTLTGAKSESETLEKIASADAFILASLMEGLPVVLMEAMALSKPVVAPSVAGIPELVNDDTSGLLFRPSDWRHLEECMQQLVGDRALCRRLGAAGRQMVESEFAIDIAVEPLARFFGRIQHNVA